MPLGGLCNLRRHSTDTGQPSVPQGVRDAAEREKRKRLGMEGELGGSDDDEEGGAGAFDDVATDESDGEDDQMRPPARGQAGAGPTGDGGKQKGKSEGRSRQGWSGFRMSGVWRHGLRSVPHACACADARMRFGDACTPQAVQRAQA